MHANKDIERDTMDRHWQLIAFFYVYLQAVDTEDAD